MRLNGWNNPEYYPKLVFSDIETPDVRELGAALTGLAGAGLITPDDSLEKWIREFANLPPIDMGTNRPAEEEVHENDGTYDDEIVEEPALETSEEEGADQ